MPGKPIKIQDTGNEPYKYGRQELYWQSKLSQKYEAYRPGFNLMKYIDFLDQPKVISNFKLKGFEYGHWTTQDERYNFLASGVIALHDLDLIINFRKNIGLNNTIGVAFGARGKGGFAAAHFEPHTFMINLTRYSGWSSLAHEYGHALDYFFGTFIDQHIQYRSLTIGHSTATRIDLSEFKKDSLRYLALDVIKTIIWKTSNDKTDSYKRLEKAYEDSEYWFRHTELFARCFEQWLHTRLKEKQIVNNFLTKRKYETSVYLLPQDLKRVMPKMNKLMKALSEKVKK